MIIDDLKAAFTGELGVKKIYLGLIEAWKAIAEGFSMTLVLKTQLDSGTVINQSESTFGYSASIICSSNLITETPVDSSSQGLAVKTAPSYSIQTLVE